MLKLLDIDRGEWSEERQRVLRCKNKEARAAASAAPAVKSGGGSMHASRSARTNTKASKQAERSFFSVPKNTQNAIRRAIDNVLAFGDTDVLPRSFEIQVIADMAEDVEDLVAEIHLNYAKSVDRMPVLTDVLLSPVGQTGFRSVTQIDPIWNIYFLSLVISIGEKIEAARVSVDKNVVHSFRFDRSGDAGRVFTSSFGWRTFVEVGRCRAEACSHVLVTDISDFYPRIYHHRLENALKKVCHGDATVGKLMDLLMEISGNVSYGLPVGGPASRLLAELLLNATDRKLMASGFLHSRFVDDFRIFAPSKQSAHEALVTLAQFLGANEGLSLQKTKTKILSSEEFISITSPSREDLAGEINLAARDFMQIKINFDPYSETAHEDYEELRRVVRTFDVVGMLASEMRKSQIDEGLVKKVVKAIRHLEESIQNICIRSLAENLELLAPVFQVVVQTFLTLSDGLDEGARSEFVSAVKRLFSQNSHVVQVPANQIWAIRVLEKDYDDEAEQILSELFESSSSMVVRRDVIIAMANGDTTWFVSDVRKRFQTLTGWERRAVISASYVLEDEGAHWRKKLSLTGFESVVQRWTAERKSRNPKLWRIPL